MDVTALRSPLYSVPSPPVEDDGDYAAPVSAVAGHFPDLPPTPPPFGVGVDVPIRHLNHYYPPRGAR